MMSCCWPTLGVGCGWVVYVVLAMVLVVLVVVKVVVVLLQFIGSFLFQHPAAPSMFLFEFSNTDASICHNMPDFLMCSCKKCAEKTLKGFAL